MEEYEKTKATIKLMSKLSEAEQSVKNGEWISGEDVKKELGI